MSADRHGVRTADDYAEVFAAGLPTGPAWSRDPDDAMMRVVQGLMGSWGRVDSRIDDLLSTESDPRSTFQMLGDWEAAFGLPDLCVRVPQTIEDRRNALVAKIATVGGQSRAFFIQKAADLGYTVSIYEYAPYLGGISVCGETRPDGNLIITYAECGVMECGADTICTIVQTGGDEWAWQSGPPELRYFWKVKISGTKLTWLRGGTGECGRDHECEIGLADDLECLFRRYKPGHTEIIFDYSQATTSPAGILDMSKPSRSLAPFLLLF